MRSEKKKAQKKKEIYPIDIKEFRPLGYYDDECDRDVAKFATLVNKMLQPYCDTIKMKGLARELSILAILYTEDVISDCGIWKSFRSLCDEKYGKFPFYGTEADYDEEGVNLSDIKFLVWYRICCNRKTFFNPDSEVVTDISDLLYQLLQVTQDELFINDTLRDFFKDAEFMDEFLVMRDVLKWLYFDCYLTKIQDSNNKINEFIDTYKPLYNDKTYYAAECVVPLKEQIGPLGLTSAEWLSAILKTHGHTSYAKALEGSELLEPQTYIQRRKNDEYLEFETMDGETFRIYDEDGSIPDAKIFDEDMVSFASFVKYQDKYYLNGLMSSIPDFEIFKKMKEDYQSNPSLRNLFRNTPLVNASKYEISSEDIGSRLYYFEDTNAGLAFIEEKVKPSNSKEFRDSVLEEFGYSRNVALYYESNDKPFCLMCNAAEIIKDPKNPYYNPAKENNITINTINIIPKNVLIYLVEREMIPSFGINTSQGVEHGKKIIKDNLHFVMDYLYFVNS